MQCILFNTNNKLIDQLHIYIFGMVITGFLPQNRMKKTLIFQEKSDNLYSCKNLIFNQNNRDYR